MASLLQGMLETDVSMAIGFVRGARGRAYAYSAEPAVQWPPIPGAHATRPHAPPADQVGWRYAPPPSPHSGCRDASVPARLVPDGQECGGCRCRWEDRTSDAKDRSRAPP